VGKYVNSFSGNSIINSGGCISMNGNETIYKSDNEIVKVSKSTITYNGKSYSKNRFNYSNVELKNGYVYFDGFPVSDLIKVMQEDDKKKEREEEEKREDTKKKEDEEKKLIKDRLEHNEEMIKLLLESKGKKTIEEMNVDDDPEFQQLMKDNIEKYKKIKKMKIEK
jgi:IMP dehydrogenase/GMP reductase